MSDFRRYFVPGGTYFFTLVTARRTPIFQSQSARTLLGRIMRDQREEAPMETVAIVLLADHLHTIWTLPDGDDDYPNRWKTIKAKFTSQWLHARGVEQETSIGYRRQRRRGVWQPRFWEHTIDDEDGLEAHFDYIHYNPVKHGYCERSVDWPWSSFHRYLAEGHYPPDWGYTEPPHLKAMQFE